MHNKFTGSLVIEETACALLVLLWVYAAVSKWLNYESFVYSLQRQPVGFFAPLLSVLLPVSELALAGLLLWPGKQNAGLVGSLVLLLLFSFYIIWILLFANSVPCSCGGIISQLSWKGHLLLNGLFTGLAIAGLNQAETSPTPTAGQT